MFALSPFAFPSISVPSGDGGASDFNNLPLETLNINTGWTTATRGGGSFSLSASYDGSGVGTYTLGASSGITSDNHPVIYRQAYAVDSDGVKQSLTTADTFFLISRISNVTLYPDVTCNVFFGLTAAPTANASTYRPIGAEINRVISPIASARFNVIAAAGFTSFPDGKDGRCEALTQFQGHSGNSANMGAITAVRIVGTDRTGVPLTRTDANNISSGPIYMAFHIYPYLGSTTAGDEVEGKIEFACIKLKV